MSNNQPSFWFTLSKSLADVAKMNSSKVRAWSLLRSNILKTLFVNLLASHLLTWWTKNYIERHRLSFYTMIYTEISLLCSKNAYPNILGQFLKLFFRHNAVMKPKYKIKTSFCSELISEALVQFNVANLFFLLTFHEIACDLRPIENSNNL